MERFVSFWGMNGSVYLQRFDSALNKVGSEQNVKPSDVSEQIDFNSATALDDGGFLVAYVVDNGDGGATTRFLLASMMRVLPPSQ